MSDGVEGTVQAVFDITSSGVTIVMLRDWAGDFAMPARLTVGADTIEVVGYDWPRSTYNVAAAQEGNMPELAVAVAQLPAARTQGWPGMAARIEEVPA